MLDLLYLCIDQSALHPTEYKREVDTGKTKVKSPLFIFLPM